MLSHFQESLIPCFLCLTLCYCILKTGGQLHQKKHQLPVLLLYPNPDSSTSTDQGLDILPAARIAVREVNNHSDILPGYEFVLRESRSEDCSNIVPDIGLNHFVANVFNTRNTDSVVAITGLPCSLTTDTVSPIAGRSEVSLIQMAMSTANCFRNTDEFPYLWRLLPSVKTTIEAIVFLMEEVHWYKVAYMYQQSHMFYQSTAHLFQEAINRSEKFELLYEGSIADISDVTEGLLNVRANKARLIFVSVNSETGTLLLCEAARLGMVWSDYVWVVLGDTFRDVYNLDCGLDSELDNVIVLDLDVTGRSQSDLLVSGLTYREYTELYHETRREVYREFNKSCSNSYHSLYYSNPMYDEIWALALAMNASLPIIHSLNLSLDEYTYNNSIITDIIDGQLFNTEFSGATTNVRFNKHKESNIPVRINQIRNGSRVCIGQFTNSVLSLYNITWDQLPDDDLIVQHYLLGEAALTLLGSVIVVIMLLIAFLAACALKHRQSPEIRAIGLPLGTVIFVDTYLLMISVFTVVLRQSVFFGTTTFTALCIIEQWLTSIAFSTSIGCILLTIARVYRIFSYFGYLSNCWHTKYLTIYIFVLALPHVVILTIWMVVDPFSYTEYIIDDTVPYKTVFPYCHSKYKFVFEPMLTLYVFLLTTCVAVLAFRTRKVKRKHFKDTKKILLMIYTSALFLVFLALFWSILEFLEIIKGLVLLAVLYYIGFVSMMIIFLILPKVVPALFSKRVEKAKELSDSSSTNITIYPSH